MKITAKLAIGKMTAKNGKKLLNEQKDYATQIAFWGSYLLRSHRKLKVSGDG